MNWYVAVLMLIIPVFWAWFFGPVCNQVLKLETGVLVDLWKGIFLLVVFLIGYSLFPRKKRRKK